MIDQLRNPISAISQLAEHEHCLYFANNSYIGVPRGDCTHPLWYCSLSSGTPPCICGSVVASENVPSQPRIAAEGTFSPATVLLQILRGGREFSER